VKLPITRDFDAGFNSCCTTPYRFSHPGTQSAMTDTGESSRMQTAGQAIGPVVNMKVK
jgi:hypothetical protein